MRVFFGIIMVLASLMWALDVREMARTWDAQNAASTVARTVMDTEKEAKAREELRLARMESRAVWDSMGFATLIFVVGGVGLAVDAKK